MTAQQLTPLLFLLTGLAWTSTLILAYFASRKPRIGALTERTVIAVIISVIGTISCLLVLNTDQGRPYFDRDTASLLFRSAMLLLLLVPTGWLVLFFAGRLGRSGKG